MEIKPFERMRAGKAAREIQEVTMLLRPNSMTTQLDDLRPPRTQTALSSVLPADTSDQMAALLAENKRLRASLDRAVKINDKMWEGIVDMKLDVSTQSQ